MTLKTHTFTHETLGRESFRVLGSAGLLCLVFICGEGRELWGPCSFDMAGWPRTQGSGSRVGGCWKTRIPYRP